MTKKVKRNQLPSLRTLQEGQKFIDYASENRPDTQSYSHSRCDDGF